MPEFNVRLPFAIAALALTLGGCSSMDVSTVNLGNLNPFSGEDALRSSSFNYFYKKDTVSFAPVTTADLVGPDGRCAYGAAPATSAGVPSPQAAPEEAPAASPINPRSNQALYFTAGPETGRVASAPAGALPPEVRNGPNGISLAMTECQLVNLAGYTDRIEISTDARGERLVTLTYPAGDRPGIYRFKGGRLVSMERTAEPPQAKKPQRAAKTTKSKPAQ